MNTITLPVSRAASIASSIGSALMASHGDTLRANQAREDATEAAGNATAGREILMGTLALASADGDWHINEIEEAMNVVAKGINDDKSRKTMNTLISEVKHAAYPNGRAMLASLVSARNAAWDAEDAEKKAAKEDKRKPDDLMTRAFSRRYQTLVAMLRAVNEPDASKRVAFDLTTEGGLLDWARSRDPLRSPKALADKVAGLRDALAGISVLLNGHESTLASVVGALGFVNEASIAAAFAGPAEILHEQEENLDDGEGNNSGSDGENTEEVPNDPGHTSAIAQAFTAPRAVPQVVINLPATAQVPAAVQQDVGDLDALLATA